MQKLNNASVKIIFCLLLCGTMTGCGYKAYMQNIISIPKNAYIIAKETVVLTKSIATGEFPSEESELAKNNKNFNFLPEALTEINISDSSDEASYVIFEDVNIQFEEFLPICEGVNIKQANAHELLPDNCMMLFTAKNKDGADINIVCSNRSCIKVFADKLTDLQNKVYAPI